MLEIQKSLIFVFVSTMFVSSLTFGANKESKSKIVEDVEDIQALTNEDDTPFFSDLYLTHDEFVMKYLDEKKDLDPKFLYRLYMDADDDGAKIYVLRSIVSSGWNNAWVFRVFQEALMSGLDNGVSFRDWKIRVVAHRLIQEHGKDMSSDLREKFSSMLFHVLHVDPDERSRGMAVLALATLYEDKATTGDASSWFASKENIVLSLNRFLKSVPDYEFFYAWALTRALGRLKSPSSLVALLQIRQRRISAKVMLEISRAVHAIIGGGSSQESPPPR